jgi:hypothetical protein
MDMHETPAPTTTDIGCRPDAPGRIHVLTVIREDRIPVAQRATLAAVGLLWDEALNSTDGAGPITATEVASLMGVIPEQAAVRLAALRRRGVLVSCERGDRTGYCIPENVRTPAQNGA